LAEVFVFRRQGKEKAMKKGLLVLALMALWIGPLGGGCGDDGSGSKEGNGGDGDSDGDGDDDDDDDDDDDACRSIDLVISVDVSSSMEEELRAMREDVFPALAERLKSISKDDDSFRVATLDSCPTPANFHTRGADDDDCDFEGGNVWIRGSSPDLNDEFACVGDVYIGDVECSGENDDEQPVSAVITALNEPWVNNQNEGFLRDEALLVVIAITDEDEQPTDGMPGDSQGLYNLLVGAKGGDPDRVVFLGVGGSTPCVGEYGEINVGADLLQGITREFGSNGIWWDLCDGRLEDGLEDAINTIQVACETIAPI
jgi:hypothetical protein